jgi:hypothetical protein
MVLVVVEMVVDSSAHDDDDDDGMVNAMDMELDRTGCRRLNLKRVVVS